MVLPSIEKFMARVRKCESSCWIWTGAKIPTGYGIMKVAGKVRKVHRVAYELFVGPIPTFLQGMDKNGVCVIHSCDNPSCVNPDHLRVGTHADNVRDRVAKNRSARLYGFDHPKAKLTPSILADMRRLYGMGVQVCQLAAEFGIHRDTVRRSLRRERYDRVAFDRS